MPRATERQRQELVARGAVGRRRHPRDSDRRGAARAAGHPRRLRRRRGAPRRRPHGLRRHHHRAARPERQRQDHAVLHHLRAWCRCGVGRSWCTAPTCPRQAPYRRARGGVLVAPESRGIFPGLTVEENLVLRLPGAAARDEVYERFPVLRERRRLASGSLSGGEQQMLALAPVLVDPPSIVVADEPTLGLAPHRRRRPARVRGAARSGQRGVAGRGEGAQRARDRASRWRSWRWVVWRGAALAPTSTTSGSWPPISAPAADVPRSLERSSLR